MPGRLEIEFGVTKMFVDDENRLSGEERTGLVAGLNRLADMARDGSAWKMLYRKKGVRFPDWADRRDSSLYMFRPWNCGIRVILAYDDDPVFDRKIITLYRVVDKGILVTAFEDTAQILYGRK